MNLIHGNTKLFILGVFPLMFTLAGPAAAQTLTAITVEPPDPTINVGQTQPFTATGTFSDGSSPCVLNGDSWCTKAPMPTPRHSPAVVVANGLLYAMGGYNISGGRLATVEAYNPATNTWTTNASMPTPRHSPTAGVVDGILYVIGGQEYRR